MTVNVNVSYIKLFLQRLEELAKQRRTNLKTRHQRQREYQQLAGLPDYLLKDMGIKRADLNLKLNKPFWWS